MSDKKSISKGNNKTITFERGSAKYFIIEFITLAIAACIVWPLLDLLICNVFTHSDFSYTAIDYILKPVIFALIFVLIDYVIFVVRKK